MSDAAAAPVSLKTLVLGDLEREIAQTRRMLERLPEEHLAWKPHPKSMSLGGLSLHLANLLFWTITTLEQDSFDLAGFPRLPDPTTTGVVMKHFDENAAKVRDAFARLDDAALEAPWTLRMGERVFFTVPRREVLREHGISHMVHHRGQLSVYLRLLDVPLPGMYGPTADEPTPG